MQTDDFQIHFFSPYLTPGLQTLVAHFLSEISIQVSNKYLKLNLSKTNKLLFSLANLFFPLLFPSQLLAAPSFQLLRRRHPGVFTLYIMHRKNILALSLSLEYTQNSTTSYHHLLLSSESLDWFFKNVKLDPVTPSRTLQ